MKTFLKNKDVILISSSNYALKSESRLNVHIIASEFSKKGTKVLFVETLGLKVLPLYGASDILKVGNRIVDFLKMLFLGPRNVEENIFIVSIVRFPFDEIPFFRHLNELVITYFVKKYANKYLSPSPLLWMFLPTASFLSKKIKNSGVIYHCVDDYAAIPFVDKSYVINHERKAVKIADIIFVVSSKKQLEFKDYTSCPIIYLNNVANFELFNNSIKSTEIPADMVGPLEQGKPIVGFVGNLAAYKEDINLLTNIVKTTPEFNYVLIGGVGEGELVTNIYQLKRQANVFMLGPKKYNQLYKYVKYFDVAIIPRKMNAVGEGGFPMKYFEFLAAGKPTIVTGVGNMAQFTKFSQFGGVANTPEKFKERIKYWIELSKNDSKEYIKGVKARVKIAKLNSWERRIEQLNAFVTKIIK